MIRFKKNRVQSLTLLLLFWLFVNAAARALLPVMMHRTLSEALPLPALIAVHFREAVNDLFPCILLMLPLLPFLPQKKRLWDGRTEKALASLAFWLYGCAFLFSAMHETLLRSAPESVVSASAARESALFSPLPLMAALSASAALFLLLECRKRIGRSPAFLPTRRPPRRTGAGNVLDGTRKKEEREPAPGNSGS